MNVVMVFHILFARLGNVPHVLLFATTNLYTTRFVSVLDHTVAARLIDFVHAAVPAEPFVIKHLGERPPYVATIQARASGSDRLSCACTQTRRRHVRSVEGFIGMTFLELKN